MSTATVDRHFSPPPDVGRVPGREDGVDRVSPAGQTRRKVTQWANKRECRRPPWGSRDKNQDCPCAHPLATGPSATGHHRLLPDAPRSPCSPEGRAGWDVGPQFTYAVLWS